jgi:hypothetical protein
MSDQGDTVFRLEHLRAAWLPSAWARTLVSLAPAAFFGVVLGLANLFLTRALASAVQQATLPVFHLAAWCAFGVVAGFSREYSLPWRIAAWGAFGSICGLVFSFVVPDRGTLDMLLEPLYFAALFGLVGEMLVWFVPGEFTPAESLSWSWRRAKPAFLRRLLLGIAVGVPYGFLYGASTYVRGNVRPGDLLVVMAVFSVALGVVWGASRGLAVGLDAGPIPTQIVPNEGIRLSARHGIAVGLSTFLIAFAIFTVGLSWMAGPRISMLLGIGWALGAGLLWGLASGLGAVIQHVVIRLMLWQHGMAPIRYVPWLEHAVRLRFVYSAGGGYVFMHRVVQEYFASPRV